ncbi:MAG: 3',5'-cyclic adenosine monophosphate phosphodiesterase CpdA [Hyphomicrobiaceae bacterium hypho_1]
MSKIFKLAHLSDLHLGPAPIFWPWHWNIKRFLGYINWLYKRRYIHNSDLTKVILDDVHNQNIDHVAVSGDFSNFGLPIEHSRALTWLQLAGQPEKVSAVPGNHDVYSRLLRDQGILRWKRYMSSFSYRQEDGKSSNYVFDHFPYVRRWGNIALIGLNSAIPTNVGSAVGKIGKKQLSLLKTILENLQQNQTYRIVMLHHPPLPEQAIPLRNLLDATQLTELFMTVGVELVIHGHSHKQTLEYRYWNNQPFPVVSVPSCSASTSSTSPASYNIYVFTPNRQYYYIDLIQRQILPDTMLLGEIRRQRLIPPVKNMAPNHCI